MPFDYQKFMSQQNKLIDEIKKCYDGMADEEKKANVAAKHKKYRQTHTHQIERNKQQHY